MHNNIEYEARILNIDIESIKAKLNFMGATPLSSYLQRRYVFDVIPAKKGTWIRLRTNGNKSTLALKQIDKYTIDGTREWETEVSDFDAMQQILERAGIKPKGYQENKRTAYQLDGIEVTIDEWPQLKPYIEIEGPDAASVEAVILKLGFKKSELSFKNTIDMYADLGIDLDKVSRLVFTD